MKSLLVVGGSGFFGKSILDAYQRGLLLPWGISSIQVFARHAESLRQTTPQLLGPDIELINGDIGSCKRLPFADYVIHAAASTDAARYLSEPAREKANILAATSNYCQLAKQYHRESKILYVSSGAIYGKQNPKQFSLTENDIGPIELMDVAKQDYAAAKRDGERLIQDLGGEGYQVSIARCFAFVGPYLPRDQHFAIGNFLRDGFLGRNISVKGEKKVIRTYMYVDDLVLWMMAILNMADKDCPIFNVGSDEAIEIGDLAENIASIFGVSVNYMFARIAEEDRYIPSINKGLSKGLKINYSIESSIKETIKRIKELKNE